ncbi:hypothetical protein L1887_20231 [Cichorium endivia]|nr:hypothetical protein L1887_20231 [Cichorium endivia]
MASTTRMDSSDRIQLPLSSPEATEPMLASIDTRLKPHQDQALVHCPRCDSTNTKFCYYNNYSLSQPRYFCKSCRRYWTKGGTLRNIPVGGGSRKNKKLSSTSRKPTTAHQNHQQSTDGSGIRLNSDSLRLSHSESPAQFPVYPNYIESGGAGGEYEGDGPFPAMVASGSGGYGADTCNTHGLSLFGEMEHYENMMNGVDVKTRVFAFEWQEQTGCRLDLYGALKGETGYSGI